MNLNETVQSATAHTVVVMDRVEASDHPIHDAFPLAKMVRPAGAIIK
jgi:hypothetical protein